MRFFIWTKDGMVEDVAGDFVLVEEAIEHLGRDDYVSETMQEMSTAGGNTDSQSIPKVFKVRS